MGMVTLTVRAARTAVAPHRTPESSRQDWDAADARRQLLDWAGIERVSDATETQRSKFARGFAFVRGEGAALADYMLPHHYVEGGQLVLSRRGLMAAGGLLRGARGGVDIPANDIRAVRAHLGAHYRALELEPPWSDMRSAEVVRRPAGTASTAARQADLAVADEPRRKLYYVMSRADVPDSNGMVIDAKEIERSSDRFMLKLQRGCAVVGIDHLCAHCPHQMGQHIAGGQPTACRADNCLCTGYCAFAGAPFVLVENFVAGADIIEWHGVKLAEPLKRGDHVIGVRVEHDGLFSLLSSGSSVSWEGSFTVQEIPAQPAPPARARAVSAVDDAPGSVAMAPATQLPAAPAATAAAAPPAAVAAAPSAPA